MFSREAADGIRPRRGTTPPSAARPTRSAEQPTRIGPMPAMRVVGADRPCRVEPHCPGRDRVTVGRPPLHRAPPRAPRRPDRRPNPVRVSPRSGLHHPLPRPRPRPAGRLPDHPGPLGSLGGAAYRLRRLPPDRVPPAPPGPAGRHRPPVRDRRPDPVTAGAGRCGPAGGQFHPRGMGVAPGRGPGRTVRNAVVRHPPDPPAPAPAPTKPAGFRPLSQDSKPVDLLTSIRPPSRTAPRPSGTQYPDAHEVAHG